MRGVGVVCMRGMGVCNRGEGVSVWGGVMCMRGVGVCNRGKGVSV